MRDSRVLLAIPVFNEGPYVARVLERARRYIADILVINDGSTDDTAAVLAGHAGKHAESMTPPTFEEHWECRVGHMATAAPRPCHPAAVLAGQRHVHVIEHAENRGYGQSIADAFAFALRQRFDWLITMDCDEQHEPSFIPRFVEAAEADDADIISGSRYLHDFNDNGSPPEDRRAINRCITALLNDRLSLGITDAFCGFKAYRVASLAHFNITVPGYAMPLQLWVQAARAALRVTELPVRLIYNDPNRHFGGILDDPTARLNHYLDVLEMELHAAGYPALDARLCPAEDAPRTWGCPG